MHPNIMIKTGDITKESVCAIVNAANSSLLGGGGVDGAIHRAGGKDILHACKDIRNSRYPDGLPAGQAVATTAGKLPSKYVIHTVGPIYTSCGETCRELLASCYTRSLEVAQELNCHSIAFPAISTGIYGYPKEEAASIAYQAVEHFLKHEKSMRVIFIFHTKDDALLFQNMIEKELH